MRLLKIQLENFGSHQQSSIDLSGITSATVSGKNGSGKSTVFVDAVLWALFGKCRSDTDAMMTHDKQRMMVTLDFSLDGQPYRVSRMRSKTTKTGKSELTFQAINDRGEAVAVGGHKLTETQEAIKSVLNADYDLCATSNFLIQGKADKFSTATPSERKTIMAQVLRLDEYAILKTATNKRGIQIDSKLAGMVETLAELQEKSESSQKLKNEIEYFNGLIRGSGEKVLTVQTQLKAHLETKGKKQADLEALVEQKKILHILVDEQRKVSESLKNYHNNQARLKTIVGNKDEINEAATRFEQLTTQLETSKATEVHLLKEKSVFDNELIVATDRKAKEEQTLQRCKHELGVLEQQKELALQHQTIMVKEVQRELTIDTEKGKLLDVVPCWKELQDKCQFTIDAVAAMEGLGQKKTKLAGIEQKDFVKEQVPNYEVDKQTRLGQITTLSATTTREKVKAITEKSEATGELIVQLLFRRDSVIVEYDRVKAKADLKPTLDSSIKELEQLQAFIDETTERLKAINEKIMATKNLSEEGTTLQDWLLNAVNVEDELRNEEGRINADINQNTAVLGKTRHMLAESEAAGISLTQTRLEWDQLQLQREATFKLHGYYSTIPIMIMEQAVPTLEATANGILEKISSSGMRIRLETQKALKTSDRISETLDIIVRDIFGEKPYENYSGGERFRLDLALRFGLSQLLMHRAGSKLESLIIDEGLGSLDGDGLALLRECLGKLETSFGLILVISHVEEIQGTFEQEIMVEKNAFGSQIKVL